MNFRQRTLKKGDKIAILSSASDKLSFRGGWYGSIHIHFVWIHIKLLNCEYGSKVSFSALIILVFSLLSHCVL